MRDARGAVDEVPLAQRTLLPLDDQQRFAVDYEEVLLGRLSVVHRHRLARLEHEQAHAELLEPGLALEHARGADRAAIPARIARVEDEPALASRNEPDVGRLERGLGNTHARRLTDVQELAASR